VLPAGFVTATATARAAGGAVEVSIVASGRHGTDPAVEDDLTADFIEAALTGSTLDKDVAALARESESADRFRTRASAKPADVDLCCDVDRFDFSLVAALDTRGYAIVTRLDP
jgi:phosphosulfolactate phosphohydrolase-like enzyme